MHYYVHAMQTKNKLHYFALFWGAPEAESSVAFEALAEEPNLTLVTDSFSQFIWRNIRPNVYITEIWRG